MYTKISALVLMVALVITPLTTQASTHYGEAYDRMTTEEKIAYLYGMIAQLQMLVELMLAAEADTDDDSSSGSRSNLDVDTLSATDIETDEAELRGRIDLNREKVAFVWFEYGERSSRLDEQTTERRITDYRGDIHTHAVIVDDLDEGERYYYRVVAEDEDGDRAYGAIRSFVTEDDSNDDDSTSATSGDFELSLSDTSIEVGESVDVDWEIPSADAGGQNWIGLYREGAANATYVEWTYIGSGTSGTETFTLSTAGDYEFRLFLNNSYEAEVESVVVEVN